MNRAIKVEEVRDMLKTHESFYVDNIFYKYANGYNKVYCVCKCLEDESHGFWTASLNRLKYGTGCPKCGQNKVRIFQSTPKYGESIFEKRGDLIKYLKYPDDAHKYYPSGRMKLHLICPDCGAERDDMTMNTLSRQGYSCKICSDGLSLPEKFTINILNQIGIVFETQKTFEWSSRKKYDFYIPSLNMIIETHGNQHYVYCGRGRSLEEEQENDEFKEKLAKGNGIKHYVVIDCRESQFEWLRENFISSLHSRLSLSNIDWELAFYNAQSSLKIKAWEAWNNKLSYETTTIIGNKIGLSQSSMIKYLKAGNAIGKCIYDAEIERKKSGPINSKNRVRSVKQYSTNKVFIKEWESIASASESLNINGGHISCCCKNRRKTSGGFVWEYA